MKTLSSKNGFSLVELLTVIAIIAILAAIIFPVMATVKERARQNQCMTQLKQIAVGLKMFKTDNRMYPKILVEVKPGDIMANAASGNALFREYVTAVNLFHCPSARDVKGDVVLTFPSKPYSPKSDPMSTYAYDSYDCYNVLESGPELHYCPDWAPDVDTVKGLPATTGTDQQDFERQLKFRNPPDDTIVTWCSNHSTRTATSVSGKDIVVFLDGHTEMIDAGKMLQSKWRMRPQ